MLPRIAGAIPFAAWFIVVNEFAERFAYYGGSTPFQNYIQYPAQNATQRAALQLQPGALDRGVDDATRMNNFFTFWVYLCPLIGAFISDQYWGKFKTILVFSSIYLLGWILLTVSSIPTGFYPDDTPYWGSFAYPGFWSSIVIIGLGAGGIKSIVSPMCADQLPSEPYMKDGKIIDPDLTVQHLYNWFYWAINVGAMCGQLICTTAERSAFWKAYLIP
ncbi:POT family-domain-containing protein, partial [Blyttiomyces helicus]